MPYGTIKVDTITFTDGGVDKSVAISGLVQNPTFTGNVTATGTVSGTTVRATTVSGVTISGTTVNAASGVFTTQISGAVVVAPAGTVGTPSVQVGAGATVAPGLYGAGTDQLGISVAGSSRLVVDSVGQIRIVTLGSAAAPALVVGNDLNTGLYSLGADQVAISTAGTGRLFVDDSGNVGIGSAPSTTAGRLLDINGGLLQPTFQLRATSATAAYVTYTLDTVNSLVTFVSSDWPIRYFINGNERLRIDSSGRVGIGTSSPLTKLDVRGGVITAGSNTSTNGTELLRGYYDYGAISVIGSEYSSGGIVIGSSVKPSTSAPGQFFSSTSINIERGAYTIAGNVHKWYIGTLQTVPENSLVSTAEVMRIDGAGRLLVGTSSSRQVNASINALQLQIEGTTYQSSSMSLVNNQNAADGSYIILGKSRGTTLNSSTIVNPGDSLGALWFCGADGNTMPRGAIIDAVVDGTPGASDMPTRLVFSTTADGASSPTERMRISNNGKTLIKHGDNDSVLISSSTATSGYASNQLQVLFEGYAPNNATAKFLYCADTVAIRAEIRSNGGLANYQANDVNLSDRNAKKDISPAAGTWDCIKEWEIVNYRYKDQPDDADLNLGVIAQQVAKSCPEVITVFSQATEDEPEKLGVKEQQMYWMAIKALQEAQVRIETLEAKVAALESK